MALGRLKRGRDRDHYPINGDGVEGFYHEAHSRIYWAMVDLYGGQEPVDLEAAK